MYASPQPADSPPYNLTAARRCTFPWLRDPSRHRVVESAVADGRCFVEGIAGIDGAPPTHTFLVSAVIESDGRISRYFALMAETPT